MAYLEELIPTDDLVAWYPLEDAGANASRVATVTDESGNSRTLTAQGVDPDNPSWETDSLNGYPSILHAGEDPLLYASDFSPDPKDVFIVAKYDSAANFGGTYRGLLGSALTHTILAGDSGASSTKFQNQSFSTYLYYKSQTAYAEAAQEAPFDDFELLQATRTGGDSFTMTSIQVGQRVGNTSQRWLGRWMDLLMYSAIKTAAERRRIHLYYDLKYHLFALNGTTLYFPDPTTTNNIRWSRFKEEPRDWNAVTVDHTYDDEGKSFNTSTPTPPTFWEIGFTGLTYEQMQIFDAFNNAARRDRTFSLIDKWGVTNTGVRIVDYQRDHDGHKSWSHSCTFRLAKFA